MQADSIVPQPGNPQALNRYAYAANNPVRYRDPSGHWVETAWDVLNVGWDIAEVKRDPSLLNVGALVVDVAAVIAPAVPAGVGLLVRSSKAAKAAVEVASHADEAVDAARLVNRAADATAGLRRFQEVGTEVVPDLLKAFGDGGRVAGEIPTTLSGRGTRVVGRWWDTEVAEEFGERIFKPAAGASWIETAKANYAWIQDAVKNGEIFYLASPVDLTRLSNDQFGIAVFARELDALLQAGYRRVGDYLVPPH